MRVLRATRSPGATAAVGLLTTGLLGFVGFTFLESKPMIGYLLLAAAAFRLFRVVVDLSRARRWAAEDDEDDD
jgi:hypothetical protein